MEQHAMHSITTTATTAMSTSSSSPEMGKHAGMHMSSCKISMLWNWNTIDSCFLSSTWHITSNSEFAGSCIGVICLVLVLELLRRIGREYDAFIIRRARLVQHNQYLSLSLSPADTSTTAQAPAPDTCIPSSSRPPSPPNGPKPALATTTEAAAGPPTIRPTPTEQLIRALLHTLQFAVAYFIMLLAMYFNGYIIICIFIGAFLGAFIFSWEGLSLGGDSCYKMLWMID
ncbi:Ctr-domain-containing protein [Aspergillus campestris IBT 28561]|uniref:Copper transport protein n=1 Tax=Aspergillus campestris (strain IBT 28561) TaxID=1392248 RepID=A0A2I1D9A4_ASPC2|nr:Ctr-domain-containing protein [Aspergillus campestris IBT 28561]PKY06449.1 Ctr-domain-containing protein [Aspergillus campestris IBT 28561]